MKVHNKTIRIKRKLFVPFSAFALIFCFYSLLQGAGTGSFGKNKVQYKNLEWSYFSIPHFNIYFHQNQANLPEITSYWAENAYKALQQDLNHTHKEPVPLLTYGSPILFEQTNVIMQLIPEGVGGFTELFKNRIVIPFTGSYEEYRHVIHHELVHAFQYSILYKNLGSALIRASASPMPLWLAEGTAEYLSSGWDRNADMFIMDRVIFGSVPVPGPQLNGYMAYKGGQSFFHFLESSMGDSAFHELLVSFTKTKNIETSLENVYGKKLEKLGKEWQHELKRIYWPEIGRRKKPDSFSEPVTSREGYFKKTYYNLKPRISPDGEKVAFYSDKKDYTQIYVTTLEGKKLFEISQFGYGGYFESFQPFRSGLCWGPQNNRLAFVTKNRGQNEIRIVNINSGDTEKILTFDLKSMSYPDWSPDGRRLTFCGLKKDRSDIYLYDMEKDSLERLTSDIFYEISPRFSPDGKNIIYSMQDTSGQANRMRFGKRPGFDLYLYSIDKKTVKKITDTPWSEKEAVFSPDGKSIAFISDRNGIDNIYVSNLDDIENTRALTDIIGGCSSPDWPRSTDTLVYSLFQNQRWDIWKICNTEEKLLDSMPVMTKWMESLNDTGICFYTKHKIEKDSISPIDSADETAASETSAKKDIPDKVKTEKPAEDTISDSSVKAEPESASAEKDTSVTEEDFNLTPKPYDLKFTPDLVSLSMGISTIYGYSGQGVIVLSDLLGNHRIQLAGDMQGSTEEFNIFSSYLNSKFRLDFGTGAFYNKYYTWIYDTKKRAFSNIYHDTNLGAFSILSYPFSLFSRIDFNLYFKHLKRKPFTENLEKDTTRDSYSSNIFLPSMSYVYDNILWGITGPINGTRTQTNIMIAPPIKKSDASFVSFDGDFRHYFHILKKFVWANKISFGASLPINKSSAAQRKFFLGGNTNWLIYEVNDSVYRDNIRNIFYSEYVVPFRGWNYYDLSGSRFAVINTEFRFPFIKSINIAWPLPMSIRYINGAVFIDAGNAWDPEDEYKSFPLPDKIFGGFGLGMRINLGIFILRYDAAWPTDWQTYTGKAVNYFSLGADF